MHGGVGRRVPGQSCATGTPWLHTWEPCQLYRPLGASGGGVRCRAIHTTSSAIRVTRKVHPTRAFRNPHFVQHTGSLQLTTARSQSIDAVEARPCRDAGCVKREWRHRGASSVGGTLHGDSDADAHWHSGSGIPARLRHKIDGAFITSVHGADKPRGTAGIGSDRADEMVIRSAPA